MEHDTGVVTYEKDDDDSTPGNMTNQQAKYWSFFTVPTSTTNKFNLNGSSKEKDK